MPNYEFDVYVEGNLEGFEKRYDLFNDGALAIINGQMVIGFNREASSIGAAIDSVLYGVKQCGGKVTHIDLQPSEVMLVKTKRHVAEKKD